jgi:hypothetical protein
MTGSVYVIAWDHECPVKIGVSVKVERRLADVQTHCPYSLFAAHSVEVDGNPLSPGEDGS